MSNLAIRRALETTLDNLTEKLPTAFENNEFTEPDNGAPYQEAYVLFATPDNPTMGDNFYRQRGIFQVNLNFPLNDGSKDSGLRADFLRDSFPRGLSMFADGVTTKVERTPEIGNGSNVGGRWVIIVRITFYADILGA